MDLKNGYKVIYDLAKDGKRNFYASKTGVFADAEPIFENVNIGDYKLIYEKDGMFYGSTTGIPAAGDICFEELNKVFVEDYTETTIVAEETDTEVADDEIIEEDAGEDEGADEGTENKTELEDEE
jgi:hypothetical protein